MRSSASARSSARRTTSRASIGCSRSTRRGSSSRRRSPADQVTIASNPDGPPRGRAPRDARLPRGSRGCLFLYVSFLLDQVDGEVCALPAEELAPRRLPRRRLRHLVVYSAAGLRAGLRWRSAASISSGHSPSPSRARLALASQPASRSGLPALIFGERATRLATENTEITERCRRRERSVPPCPPCPPWQMSSKLGLRQSYGLRAPGPPGADHLLVPRRGRARPGLRARVLPGSVSSSR